MELIQPDPALLQERPDPLVYRCRKCRRILACQSNVITHKKGKSVGNICNLKLCVLTYLTKTNVIFIFN